MSKPHMVVASICRRLLWSKLQYVKASTDRSFNRSKPQHSTGLSRKRSILKKSKPQQVEASTGRSLNRLKHQHINRKKSQQFETSNVEVSMWRRVNRWQPRHVTESQRNVSWFPCAQCTYVHIFYSWRQIHYSRKFYCIYISFQLIHKCHLVSWF